MEMRGNGRGNLISLPTPDARCPTQGGNTMYTLSQFRRRVNALRRKYARELAIVRLRPLAEDFSQEWAATLADRRPAPRPQPFNPAPGPTRLPPPHLHSPAPILGALPQRWQDARLLQHHRCPAPPNPWRPTGAIAPMGFPLPQNLPASRGERPGVRENQAGQSRLNSENPDGVILSATEWSEESQPLLQMILISEK